MTSRQLTRIVQDVFDKTYVKMKTAVGEDAAKDRSENLGYSSMATADTVYVQTETKIRAGSGKTRGVK